MQEENSKEVSQVYRNGEVVQISTSEIVVGEIMKVAIGDVVTNLFKHCIIFCFQLHFCLDFTLMD